MEFRQALNKEFLAKLDGLILNINQRLKLGQGGGNRKTNAKGLSIEFSDFKNYDYGDNIRHIDWNSYARLDKLFIKMFMDEKQANINILIDTSASMGFGSKAFYANMVTAALTYISLNNMDRVNIYAVGKDKLVDISSKNRFNQAVDFIDRIDFSGQFNLNSIKEIGRIQRGITVIISDMFLDENFDDILKYLQYMGQEIMLVHLLDVDEVSPKMTGDVRLIDSEDDTAENLEVNEQLLTQYNLGLKRFKNKLNEVCKKRNVNYIDITTDMDILKAIAKIL